MLQGGLVLLNECQLQLKFQLSMVTLLEKQQNVYLIGKIHLPHVAQVCPNPFRHTFENDCRTRCFVLASCEHEDDWPGCGGTILRDVVAQLLLAESWTPVILTIGLNANIFTKFIKLAWKFGQCPWRSWMTWMCLEKDCLLVKGYCKYVKELDGLTMPHSNIGHSRKQHTVYYEDVSRYSAASFVKYLSRWLATPKFHTFSSPNRSNKAASSVRISKRLEISKELAHLFLTGPERTQTSDTHPKVAMKSN